MLSTFISQRHSETYFDNYWGYGIVYSPQIPQGLAVLNRRTTLIFSLINNQRNLTELLVLAKKKDPRLTQNDLKHIISHLLTDNVLAGGRIKRSSKDTNHTLSVWLHLTNQCNLRCKYCYITKTSEQMDFTTVNKILTRLLESAKRNHYQNLLITFSGGECLLNFSLVKKTVKQAKLLGAKSGIQVQFSLITNGVLITPAIANYLKANRVSTKVSLDGLGRYNNARVFPSGKESFAYAWRGIELFQQAGVNFRVGITISRKNINGLPQLVKLLIKKHLRFTLTLVKEHGGGIEPGLTIDQQQIVTVLKRVFAIIEQAADKDPQALALFNNLLNLTPGTSYCGAGRHFAAIDCQGGIATCPMLMNQMIGNVEGGDFVHTIRQKTVFRPKNLSVLKKHPCNTCIWRYLCKGECPVATQAITGRFDVASPYCKVYQALMPDILRFETAKIINQHR